jgi:hypothetical protein
VTPIRVYVAGPYSKGDVAINVKAAITAGNAIAEAGGVPFIPHLTHFWHMAHYQDHEFWMRQDAAWLELCDALYRLPGESEGADREVEQANQQGILVFKQLAECLRWIRRQQRG